MDDRIKNAESFHKQLKEWVRFLRHSSNQLVAIFIALGAFGLGGLLLRLKFDLPAFLPEDWEQHLLLSQNIIAYVAFVFGVCLLIWATYQIWRLPLSPVVSVSSEILSHAVKGTNSFGPKDSKLYCRLERALDMAKLENLVMDEQTQLVVVMGESGSGKTSLLRSGLSNILIQRDCDLVYWEALPQQPDKALLTLVGDQLNLDLIDLDQLSTLNEEIKKEAVITLDQFEQLSPQKHPMFFELLKKIITEQRPPHKITWIIAFRREYCPTWREFELSLEDYLPSPMLSLSLFSPEQAKNVLAILAEESGLTLEQNLVDGFIGSVISENRISPVNIGIGMLMLSELGNIKNKTQLNFNDYHFAGGSQGLFTDFVNTKIEQFTEHEQEGLLKALLSLVDLESDKRIAEGRNIEALVNEADLPEKQMAYALKIFSAPTVRILEKRTNGHYRLSHESLIPSLRQLSGRILAEADRARLKLQTALQAWQNSGKNNHYLLVGADLKQVLRHIQSMAWKGVHDGKDEFLRLCLRRRFRLRSTLAICIASLLVGGYQSQSWYKGYYYKSILTAWSLPADLYDYHKQLKELEIRNNSLLHIKWLNGAFELTSLVLSGTSISSLEGLKAVPQLTSLTLSGEGISSLEGLRAVPQLTSLTLSGEGISSLEGLKAAPQLTSLTLSGTSIRSLEGLKAVPQLTSLTLSRLRISSLEELKAVPQLTSLTLSRTSIRSLEGLKAVPQLTSLTVSGTSISSLEGLKAVPQLTSLTLSGTSISSLEGLKAVPQLTSLTLSEFFLSASLEGLKAAPQLTSLALSVLWTRSLEWLKTMPQLTSLTLSGLSISSLEGLKTMPQLTSLTLSGTSISSLEGLPYTVVVLKL